MSTPLSSRLSLSGLLSSLFFRLAFLIPFSRLMEVGVWSMTMPES